MFSQAGKFIVSLIAGPLVLLPMLVIYGLVQAGFVFDEHFTSSWEVTCFFVLAVAYPVTLFYGLPVLLLLRAYDKPQLSWLLVVSMPPVAAIFSILSAGLLATICALAVSTTCWCIYRWL